KLGKRAGRITYLTNLVKYSPRGLVALSWML
ncbi:MAG: hypothetical protein ACI9MF_001249, partial [Gammaproteobacteria bacterium]